MKNLFRKIVLLSFCIVLVSCDDDDPQPEVVVDNTITGIASRTPNLSILVQALTRAGLADDLQNGTAQLTAFAPTDEAFTAYFSSLSPTINVDNIDLPTLTRVLQNHVIASKIKSADVPVAGYVSTLSPFGPVTSTATISMFVQKVGSDVFINGGTATAGVRVTTADIEASNGVIHIINSVIRIPTLVDHVIANPEFQTLETLVTNPAQSTVLNALQGLTAVTPATLFAPNNAAFTAATAAAVAAVLPLPAVPAGFAFNATPAQITTILRYHFTTSSNFRANQLTLNQGVPMFNFPPVAPAPIPAIQYTTVVLTPGTTTTIDMRDITAGPNNLSRVIQADIQASNGVIHSVNRVLRPY